jgi:N-acetylmuramoyl-L-alanine amidase
LTPRSSSLLSIVIGILLLAAALSSQGAAPGTPLTALARDGRRPIPTFTLNDQELVALDDLAAVFQLTVREEAGAITVSYKGKTIVLTPDQALASVAGRLISLPAAPTRAGRRWLVPVEFIPRALAVIYEQRLDLRKPSHLLVVGDLRVPHLTFRYDPQGTNIRLTIDATPRATSTVSQDNERLTVKFDADALDVPALVPPQPPLVQGVRVVEPSTVVVELGPRFASFRATAQPADANTMRQVIDIFAAQTTEAAPPPAVPTPPPAAAAPPAPELPPLGQASAGIRTIVIDPGHGGDDDGVIGPGGTKEKDLTLALARRAKAAIEGRLGLRVLLTRDDDRAVPVDDRSALANNNKADLLVSLHANASFRKIAGATIFSAQFAPDAEQAARAALAPERVPTFGGGLRDIDLVPWDLAQFHYLDASTAFARLLREQLQGHVPLAAEPIAQAPLRVLEAANMPAVLVETGYLSNVDQEKQLSGTEFQAAFVEALVEAVGRFRDAAPAPGGTK